MLSKIFLIVFCIIYGAYANPKWKIREDADQYGNIFIRMLLGLLGWVWLFSGLISYDKGLLYSEVAIIIILIVIAIQMKKDNVKIIKSLLLLFFASIGEYSRIFMACTIILIPVNTIFKNMAENGWESAADGLMDADTLSELDYIHQEKVRKEVDRLMKESEKEH